MRKFLILFLIFLIQVDHSPAQVKARNGMVVSDNILASEVGRDVLKKGGNAIDASIATAFALAVTHPAAGNIGGGGFIVFMNNEGNATTIDFREKAPLAATPDMYLDSANNLPRGANHFGLKAVGVPGTVAGLWMAHQKYGSVDWKELVQPAVDLAEKGFAMTWDLYRIAQGVEDWKYPQDIMLSLFLDEAGNIVEPGEMWRQPELAETLRFIRDKGKDGFYKGEVAKEIERYMKANGGLITRKDLKKYEAIEREPVKGTYKGYDIYSMPPPSSGGVALVEMMNLMEQADFSELKFNSTPYVHFLAEVMRRAYADRAEHLGDPDFNPELPLDKLTSKEFARMRYKNIDMTRASVSDTSKFGQLYDGMSTTHLSVMDKDGNAVSLTYTLEFSYGSRMGSEKLGFIFNNEMGDFNPQPGITTSRGQNGTPANLIAPEKRMLSSMTPTIIGKDGKPYLVIGSPGGRTIINTVFQTVLNVLEFEMPLKKAIEVMKIHHQWFPDEIRYEEDLLSPDTIEALEKMGHTLSPRFRLGRMMGILVDPETGVLTGAADSSSPDGGAAGY